MIKGFKSPSRMRHTIGWSGIGYLCILFGLASCAQLPQEVAKKEDVPLLVFPLPPDEARFIFERTIYNNRDVDKSIAEQDNSLSNILTGENSSGAFTESFLKPYAVTVNRGRVFVSDPATGAVKVFDFPQGRYFTIGREEPGLLRQPIGIDTDAAGNLYVADATIKAIMVFDRDGKFLRKLAGSKIGEPSLFSRLASVAVDKNGDRIYAVDIGGSRSAVETHRVRVFDARSGTHLFDVGKRGSNPGELNLPRDVAIGKDGEIFVVDGGNFRIQVFDANGKFLRNFGKVGKQLGDMARPKEVAIDQAGNVYVVDTLNNVFLIFNPQGELLMYIGGQSSTDGPARYRLPSGIAVDEDGRIYVVDQLFKKVDIFRPASIGEHEGFLGSKLPAPDDDKPLTKPLAKDAPILGDSPQNSKTLQNSEEF